MTSGGAIGHPVPGLDSRGLRHQIASLLELRSTVTSFEVALQPAPELLFLRQLLVAIGEQAEPTAATTENGLRWKDTQKQDQTESSAHLVHRASMNLWMNCQRSVGWCERISM